MNRRRLVKFVLLVFAIVLPVVVVFTLGRFPRTVLLSDVQQSKKIIVKWRGPDGYGTSRNIAFELDDATKGEFVRDLTENLGLDYFRTQATVTPTIGLYLVNDENEFVAYYAIRCARGGGRCLSMESLREIASKGRPFSEIEADDIFNDPGLRSKWPHILPWPECRYDYVLPVTPSSENPLWDELRKQRGPDPRLQYTLNGHTKPVCSLAFSPDGRILASGSWDTTIKLWDVCTGKNTATLSGHAGEVRSVTYSPDGKTLASAGGNDLTIRLWDVAAAKHTTTFNGHTQIVSTVAFSPDGQTLASGSWDTTIKLWKMATGKSIATLAGHAEYVSCVAFSKDGRTLASGSADKTVKLWDTASGKNTATLKGHSAYVSSLAFSPDGKTLASGSADSTIRLWNSITGASTATLKFPAPSAYGDISVGFSPDGKTLASGGLGRKIKLWDSASGEGVLMLSEYSQNAECLAFSPDGKALALGASDDHGEVTLWNVALIKATGK